jgi:putative tricarboxylic transport membrane protein
MTFGVTELLKGFDFLIAVIGLFGIGEILLTMEEGLAFKGKSAKINFKVVWQTWKELLKHWKTFLRSTPSAAGWASRPAAPRRPFMSYGMARRMSKDPEQLRQGPHRGRGGARDRGPRRRHQRPCCRC